MVLGASLGTLCHQLSTSMWLLGWKLESGGRVVLVEVLLLVELVEVVVETVVEVLDEVELVLWLVEVETEVLEVEREVEVD